MAGKNRIVVDYGDTDDIFYLGVVNKVNGKFVPASLMEAVNFPSAEEIYRGPMNSWNFQNRLGKEGVVVCNTDTGRLVKYKQEDYLVLHKLVTGLNEKAVWAVGPEGLPGLLERLPDEFHSWVRSVHADLMTAAGDKVAVASYAYEEIQTLGLARRDWMAWLRESNLTGYSRYVFAMADGRDVLAIAWEAVKPSGG